MWKKMLTLGVFLLTSCLLSSCAVSRDDVNNETHSYLKNTEQQETSLQYIEREQHYAIVEDAPFTYRYYIINSEGKKVLEEHIEGRMPTISLVDSNVLDIAIGYGTGIVQHRYYSIDNDYFSDVFDYVLASSGQRLVYINVPNINSFDGRKLVVRDIFDSTIFYKEIMLDFSKVETPVIAAEFINDDTQLKVTYLSGSKPNEVTEILDLIG